MFDWYEWAYFRENNAKFPLPSEVLCRVLGPAHNAGNMMAQWCLTIHGNIVPRRTVRPLSHDERNSSTELNKRNVFDQCILKVLGDSLHVKKHADLEFEPDPFYEPNLSPFNDPTIETPPKTVPHADDGAYDEMINAEVLLPSGEKMWQGTVIGRVQDSD